MLCLYRCPALAVDIDPGWWLRSTATEAKNQFGRICAEAKRDPVGVEKAGRIDTVIMWIEQYQALQASHDPGASAARAARMQAFETEFADWIAAQNAWLAGHGIPVEDLRLW